MQAGTTQVCLCIAMVVGGAKRGINFPAVHAGRNYTGMFMYCETERERLHKATPAVYSLKYICCKIFLPLLYFFNKFYLGPLWTTEEKQLSNICFEFVKIFLKFAWLRRHLSFYFSCERLGFHVEIQISLGQSRCSAKVTLEFWVKSLVFHVFEREKLHYRGDPLTFITKLSSNNYKC